MKTAVFLAHFLKNPFWIIFFLILSECSTTTKLLKNLHFELNETDSIKSSKLLTFILESASAQSKKDSFKTLDACLIQIPKIFLAALLLFSGLCLCFSLNINYFICPYRVLRDRSSSSESTDFLRYAIGVGEEFALFLIKLCPSGIKKVLSSLSFS